MTATNPDSDPDALRLLSIDASEMVLPIAGLGSRSYAFIIDWHIRALMAAAWVATFLGVSYLSGDSGFDDVWLGHDTVWYWLVLAPASAMYLLYHPLLEAVMHGRTPGKRMARVRIVTTTGATPSVGPILMRNAFRLIDSMPGLYVVGLLVGMFTRHHVRIGDLAAGTVLVHDEQLNASTFDTVADRISAGADLRTAELSDDLLARWSGLQPEPRRELAARLLRAQGIEPPEGLQGRKLDRWLRDALGGARDGRR